MTTLSLLLDQHNLVDKVIQRDKNTLLELDLEQLDQ